MPIAPSSLPRETKRVRPSGAMQKAIGVEPGAGGSTVRMPPPATSTAMIPPWSSARSVRPPGSQRGASPRLDSRV